MSKNNYGDDGRFYPSDGADFARRLSTIEEEEDMTKPMTKEEIEELEKLEQEATPGPWDLRIMAPNYGKRNGACLIAARNALPRLLEMAREWHKQKEELELIKFELDTRLSERDLVRKFLKETESENARLKAELEAAKAEIARLEDNAKFMIPVTQLAGPFIDGVNRIAAENTCLRTELEATKAENANLKDKLARAVAIIEAQGRRG